jgi:hypothetical protein
MLPKTFPTKQHGIGEWRRLESLGEKKDDVRK